MMRLTAALLVVFLAPLAGAQPTQLVVVRGRVVAGDGSATVLRGARVGVTGSAAPAPVFTDAEGRFAIGVTGGSQLTVRKAGFAPAVVNVAAGGPSTLEIALVRGAVLSGAVLDELGFPVFEASVRATRLDPPPGATAADLVVFTADTDDQGNYRIGSLPAGRYSVHSERALSRMTAMVHPADGSLRDEAAAKLRFDVLRRELGRRIVPLSDPVTLDARPGQEHSATLLHKARAVFPPDAPIGGFASGVILDEFGEPAEGVTVTLRRVRFINDRATAQVMTTLVDRTDDRGQFRLFYIPPGQYVLEAILEDGGFAPVFYPGVTSVAAATPFTIEPKQDVGGLTVPLVRAREARIFGFAIAADGGPLRGTVSLTSSRRSGAIALPPTSVATTESGVFEFLNVPAGEYVLRAMAGNRFAPAEFAAQFVRVDAAEVPPITIATRPASTIAGRFVLENGTGVPPQSFSLVPVPDGDYGVDSTGGGATAVNADGTFTIRGLAGQLRFALGNSPGGWWLKSVDIGGTNAAEVPVRFTGPGDSRTDVTVVLSAAGASVAGRASDDRGEPLDDYRVIVFAADGARWYARSPYVRIAGGPDVDGGFSVRGLPPGDYLVAAVTSIDGDGSSGEWQNPEFLNRLRTTADRVSLDEGERAVMNLVVR